MSLSDRFGEIADGLTENARILRPLGIVGALLIVLLTPFLCARRSAAPPPQSDDAPAAKASTAPIAARAKDLVVENEEFAEPLTTECARHMYTQQEFLNRCPMYTNLGHVVKTGHPPYDATQYEIEINDPGNVLAGNYEDRGDRFVFTVAHRQFARTTNITDPPQRDESVRNCTRVDFTWQWKHERWTRRLPPGHANTGTGSAYLEKVNGIWQLRDLDLQEDQP